MIPFKEIIKFGIVGGINTILTYCVYSVFLFFGTPYYFALLFDYIFAIFFSLIVNHHFTFDIKKKISFKMLYRMILVYGILFILNEGILFLLIEYRNFNGYAGQAIASVIIAGFSYFLQKIFVFGEKK